MFFGYGVFFTKNIPQCFLYVTQCFLITVLFSKKTLYNVFLEKKHLGT